MTTRTQWHFDYTSAELEQAAEAKFIYHQRRMEWWATELEQAEAEFKTKGVVLREVAQTGGTRTDAVIDQVLQARVGECKTKKTSHEASRNEYYRWLQAFRVLERPDTFRLMFDDLVYFGLGDFPA